MDLFVIWLLCVIVSAALLSRFNKAGSGLLLGALLGPIGLIIAIIWRLNLTADERKQHQEKLVSVIQGHSGAARPERDCPYCAERIIAAATICKHCKSAVEPIAVQAVLVGTGICPNCLHDGLDVNLRACPHCDAQFNAQTGKRVIRIH
jgi:hypothetical protein